MTKVSPPLRYLRDNLRVFHGEKIAGAPYVGAPIRLSGDERQLLTDILEYLDAQYEQRSKGGQAARGRSGRPRMPDEEISDAAKYQRTHRAKSKLGPVKGNGRKGAKKSNVK